ncbi:hypothetical protein H920_13536 [Fukomys damarensis]|uniref:Uncharacterized protein n=1 Tax=Fukomys damarensis TaxID=885580 RepID=A0A091CZ44_FUKDA|nr:hypothetical protein H920_13536 [Fukomys damarensis]
MSTDSPENQGAQGVVWLGRWSSGAALPLLPAPVPAECSREPRWGFPHRAALDGVQQGSVLLARLHTDPRRSSREVQGLGTDPGPLPWLCGFGQMHAVPLLPPRGGPERSGKCSVC